MSLLDFKEIPPHTKTERGAWPFEEFALRFLEELGYRRVSGPTHGADGGQDGIVEIDQTDDAGEVTTMRWLVSCKHNAHAKGGKGKSVGEGSEPSIVERTRQHGCQGFIGFYSTELTAGFENRLRGLADDRFIAVQWFTPSRIESIVQERYRDLRPMLLEFFPVSIVDHDKVRYLTEPAGTEHVQFKRDNPDIDILTQVKEWGVVELVGLVEGSPEIDAPFMNFVLTEEENNEVAEALGIGKVVRIPTSRFTVDPSKTLGRFYQIGLKNAEYLFLQRLPEKKVIRANIRFKIAGKRSRTVGTLRDRNMEVVSNPDGSMILRTPLPHESDRLYISSHFVKGDDGPRVDVEINLAVMGEPPSEALEIERARAACHTGASIVISDRETRKRLSTWDIPSDPEKKIDPVIAETLEHMIEIEEELDVDLVVNTNDFNPGDCDLIQRVATLVKKGQAHFPSRESVIAVERPDEAARRIVDDGVPVNVVWLQSGGVRFGFMGQKILIKNVVWVATRWQAAIEDHVSTNGKEYSMIRMIPTDESEIEAFALDLVEGEPFGEATKSLRDGMIRVLPSDESVKV